MERTGRVMGLGEGSKPDAVGGREQRSKRARDGVAGCAHVETQVRRCLYLELRRVQGEVERAVYARAGPQHQANAILLEVDTTAEVHVPYGGSARAQDLDRRRVEVQRGRRSLKHLSHALMDPRVDVTAPTLERWRTPAARWDDIHLLALDIDLIDAPATTREDDVLAWERQAVLL
ncbi:MAG: hypothetical protein IPL61_09555 [Myxococcales bacterium]|nr:hypothetical protein [Myxococcales bacterium]